MMKMVELNRFMESWKRRVENVRTQHGPEGKQRVNARERGIEKACQSAQGPIRLQWRRAHQAPRPRAVQNAKLAPTAEFAQLQHALLQQVSLRLTEEQVHGRENRCIPAKQEARQT
jgi:hypothetical protein